MKTIIWTLAMCSVIYFIYYHVIPYLQTKFMLWKFKMIFKKMAKKYDGETAKSLNKLADDFDEVNKNQEL